MTVAPSTPQPVVDRYFGKKAIILLCQLTLQQLFPLPPPSKHSIQLDMFLSYVFYRTSLSTTTILHALYLLQRLAISYSLPPSCSHSPDPLTHHRLIFTALVLSTKYNMDDPFSQKSWSIASKGLFQPKDITEMEMEMLISLDHLVGEIGLYAKLLDYQKEFQEWENKLEIEDRNKEMKLKLQWETFGAPAMAENTVC